MVKALLAGISLIFAISAQAQNEFTIKGKISGLEDSTQIVLYRSDLSVTTIKDNLGTVLRTGGQYPDCPLS